MLLAHEAALKNMALSHRIFNSLGVQKEALLNKSHIIELRSCDIIEHC